MKKFILLYILLSFQFIYAMTQKESLENILLLSKQDPIKSVLNINTAKEVSALNIDQVNNFLVPIIVLKQKIQKHELSFGMEEELTKLMPRLVIARRILDLKKNELLLGHVIKWESTMKWIEDERKRVLIGGKIQSAYKWRETVNDPYNIFKNRDYNANFYNLALKADIGFHPHSDDYWPSYRGGISYRWYKNDDKNDVNNYSYNLLNAEVVEKMSLEELKKLSPSEKYDIYTGSYKSKKGSFALTRSERKRTKVLNTVKTSRYYDPTFKIASWMGLCHAWAPSTLMYKAPKPVTLKGKTGIKVPFGSSDIKALLTLNVHHNIVPYLPPMVGNACKEDFKISNRETIRMLEPNISSSELDKRVESLFKEVCGPVDPGAFHIVLATKLAKKEGVIVDVDPGLQVWNQPVFKYEAKILSAKSIESHKKNYKLKGVRKRVTVENTIYYIKELHPRWLANYSFDSQGRNRAVKPMKLVYELDLDIRNHIVGGKWISKNKIDYVSTKYEELFKTNSYSRKTTALSSLPEIYRASIK